MGSPETSRPSEIIPSHSQEPITEEDGRAELKKVEHEQRAKREKNERAAESRYADSLLESDEIPESGVEISSNTEGKIQEIIFQRRGDGFDATYLSFLQKRPDISVTMVVSSEEEKEDFVKKVQKAQLQQNRCNFVVMGTNDRDISVWARDSYVMTRTSDGKSAVMEPKGRTRYPSAGDRDVADRIVATTGEQLLTSQLIFDGGDMRASGEYLFVGAITIMQNIPQGKSATPENVQEVMNKFEKQFGKKIKVVGSTQEINKNGEKGKYLEPVSTDVEKAEPVFHLDLYFTPLNNKTIAIADPNLTKKILQNMQDKNFSEMATELMEGIGSYEILQELRQFRDTSESLPSQKELDRIAAEMESQGFTIIRVPYFQALNFPVSYNNSLIENYSENNEQITQISIPQYGIKALDAAARNVYEQAGMKVIPIDGLAPGVTQMGALNCLTSEKRK